jgi:small conductance mechanosensitive channel
MEQIQSDATAEEKTSFLIQYFMSQREPLLNLGKTLVMALLVFLIGCKVIQWLLRLLNRWMEKTNVELSVHKFVLSVCNVLLHIFLIFCVAGVLGVGTSSIIAILGSAGLAVGLALQGSLSNFAGGILILLLKPFRVGDYIIATGVEGTVCNIDIFYTRIVTSDNKVIVIPNGTLSNSNITNTSQEEKRLLVVDFMVDSETQISRVRKILLDLLSREALICQDKPVQVQVDRLYPGRVKLLVKAWVATQDYWQERYRLLEEIKEKLQEEGISLR